MKRLCYTFYIIGLILIMNQKTHAQDLLKESFKDQCEAVAEVPFNHINPLLVFDIVKATTLPRNFRTMHDQFLQAQKMVATYEGLQHVHASASAQFSEKNLIHALPHMRGQVYIVDLRRESHGFLAGQPISWYGRENFSNAGMTCSEIREVEHGLLKHLSILKFLSINRIVKKTNGSISCILQCRVPLQKLETEAQLVNRLGLNYVRFLVSDHHIPDDSTVDDFLKFVNSLPSKAWLHFHCRGGRGRSSIFLAMFDIIHNGSYLSLENILERQFLLGSVDLQKLPTASKKMWKLRKRQMRITFMRRFYEYVRDPQGYGKMSWTAWQGSQKEIF